MKPLLALAAFLAVGLSVATAEARVVSRQKQVVRGHGHAAAQVVCAPQLALVAQPQAQVFYPAPQQVFLPQTQVVYAQPQIVAAPQVVYPPAAAQVILPQQFNYGAQAQVVLPQQNQNVRFKQTFRGNIPAAQAVMLPY